MKNLLFIILSALSVSAAGYSFLYMSGKTASAIIFLCGLMLGIFIMNIKLNSKNDRINSYKRELEKESIASTESSSRVKVLESKIEVLEKALENALNKK